jgi:hypothetical protein
MVPLVIFFPRIDTLNDLFHIESPGFTDPEAWDLTAGGQFINSRFRQFQIVPYFFGSYNVGHRTS